ncbi:hypothetical protein [Paenibacillus nanensis]|uniref:hypothetical protein n=1 Tax=Paenibacillus nanensis TaxID=393251 RepID=UPI0013C2EEC7|nr:hypothetical protein [Paenibacillus nanensis]
MKPKKFMCGEQVVFLNPIGGLMSEGILLRYFEPDEDDAEDDLSSTDSLGR